MTDEERASVNYFKAQLRSYPQVRKMIKWCDDRLNEIEYQMNQVSGVSYDKEVSTKSFDSGAKSVRWYSLLDDKARLESDRKAYMESLHTIEQIVCQKLLNMPQREREVVEKVYFKGETITSIAAAMNYSEGALRYHINEAIAKAVLNETERKN